VVQNTRVHRRGGYLRVGHAFSNAIRLCRSTGYRVRHADGPGGEKGRENSKRCCIRDGLLRVPVPVGVGCGFRSDCSSVRKPGLTTSARSPEVIAICLKIRYLYDSETSSYLTEV
jgi:hypothetical protein